MLRRKRRFILYGSLTEYTIENSCRKQRCADGQHRRHKPHCQNRTCRSHRHRFPICLSQMLVPGMIVALGTGICKSFEFRD